MIAPDVTDASSLILAVRQGWVEKFVELVHVDPIISHYRGRPFGSVNQGWEKRLTAY